MRDKAQARMTALAAIEAFERTQGDRLSEDDRQLLDLLRSDQSASEIGSAWLSIQKHFKRANDGEHVILGILSSHNFISAIPAARKSWELRVKNFGRARQAVDTLQQFLVEEPELSRGLLEPVFS
jgi:hypothetical protein